MAVTVTVNSLRKGKPIPFASEPGSDFGYEPIVMGGEWCRLVPEKEVQQKAEPFGIIDTPPESPVTRIATAIRGHHGWAHSTDIGKVFVNLDDNGHRVWEKINSPANSPERFPNVGDWFRLVPAGEIEKAFLEGWNKGAAGMPEQKDEKERLSYHDFYYSRAAKIMRGES
jgi:hypothetical protein